MVAQLGQVPIKQFKRSAELSVRARNIAQIECHEAGSVRATWDYANLAKLKLDKPALVAHMEAEQKASSARRGQYRL